MIEFTKIEWKNILSYGNNTTSFDFKKGIFKLSAMNGAGKSTLIDALHFALFGQPYRKVKLGQLVNSKNKKNMEVTLYFNIQDDNYKIHRGLKPDIFKVWKNDILVPVSSSKRGYQQILEEDILKINANLFNQVTVKSLTKNLSFMTLPKADKRAIIENLFDIEIFTLMNKNVKVKVDECDAEMKSLKKDIDNKQVLIETEMSNLESMMNLKKKLELEAEQNIKDYETEISDMKKTIIDYDKGLVIIGKKKTRKQEIDSEIQKLRSDIEKIQNKLNDYNAKILLNENKIKFLSKTCSGCPKIAELAKDEDITKILSNKTLATEIKEEKSLKIKSFDSELKAINEILAKESFINSNKQNFNRKIKELQDKIQKIKTQEIVIDRSKIEQYKNDKEELSNKYNQQAKLKLHYQTLRTLFSDDGIKTFIINKYLPHINKLLNYYLSKFSASMMFNFDSEFNEVVLTRYKEDFSYYSFSEGEKKRIDLAVLFSFIKFAMQKNKKSDTNLLILDEVTSGLDFIGADALYATMKEYRNQHSKCIININHNDIGGVEYDGIFECVIDKGFSEMSEVVL